uniref:Amino acid transporter transmembrane domain-containing protein n=1 Tax=Timema monikensis TaxID=170555 RepID=A0A7R9E767_9NEOP|nr:unnamed protein product [Timema monikensis]
MGDCCVREKISLPIMHDKIDHRPPGWRPYAEDSGSESHPLLSSSESRISRTSFGATTCMFPDSETSDLEAAPRPPPAVHRSTIHNSSRRPFAFGKDAPVKRRGSLDGDLSSATYNRFQFYSKLRSYSLESGELLAIPDHQVPASVFVPYIPGNDQEAGKQSSLVTIFSVWNTIMGSSLLVMPWGLEKAGLLTGMFLNVAMGGLCLYTTYRILQVHQLHGVNNPDGEVADLCKILLGRSAEMVTKVISLVVLLGANIVYWVLMSNFLYYSVDYVHAQITGVDLSIVPINETVPPSVLCLRHFPADNTTQVLNDGLPNSTYENLWNLHTTVPLFLVLIIVPLVNFKSATFFTKFNSLGTLSAMYLLIFVFVKSAQWGININYSDVTDINYAPQFLPSFPALSGMLALSFFIHNIIITIMRNNRHHKNNGRDLSIAYLLVTVTYALVGTVFYICFPLAKSCIEDNLLNNFQSWDPMTAVARVFLFFQLVTVYPLLTYMLRVQMFTTLLRSTYPGFYHVLLLNTAIIIVCVMFAIFLPHIGTIIRFTGALSGLVYVFTLPSLLHLASQRKFGKQSWLSILLHIAIIIIGGGNLLAQFFVQDL